MTEQEALNYLLPNGKTVIYSDEFNNLTKDKARQSIYIDLRKFCKDQGAKKVIDWLIQKNIYRDIESDMRPSDSTIDVHADAGTACAQIIDTYPLIGEYILPEEMKNEVLRRAQDIFDRILNTKGIKLSNQDNDILTVAIVQYVKWRNQSADENAESRFWAYIFSQFGLKDTEDGENSVQRLYDILRKAVQGALQNHHRFFSSEAGTHKYYNSLMLHALAPEQSMNALFEILLFFYRQDLEYVYIKNDAAFKSLVKCIAYRWDKEIELQEELNIRSNVLNSGLKALFTERPKFMRDFCEKIVSRIDDFIHGTAGDYQDGMLEWLLNRWYARKDETLLETLKREDCKEKRERIASAEDSIHLRYVLDGERVCIQIPKIRLDEIADDMPLLTIYQNGEVIFEREMEVYGQLSRTVRAVQIALADTKLDFEQALNISAEIRYNGKTILKTEDELYRTFIVFDKNGRMISPSAKQDGFFTVFANAKAEIDGDDDIHYITHAGQLMRVNAAANSNLCINGTKVFQQNEQQNELRIVPQETRIHGLRGCAEGELFDLFLNPFSAEIVLPKGCYLQKYRIRIDEAGLTSLALCCSKENEKWVLKVPSEAYFLHRIQIIDWAANKTVVDYRYAILPNAKFEFSKPIFYDDDTLVSLQFSCEKGSAIVNDSPDSDSDWLEFSVSSLDYPLAARLPIIRGTVQDYNLLKLPKIMWWKKFQESAFIKVSCPKNCQCKLYLGNDAIPRNTTDDSFELSNFLRSKRLNQDRAELCMILTTANELLDKRLLTTIILKEQFLSCPVLFEDDTLKWQPEGKYMGNPKDTFTLRIETGNGNEPCTYSLDDKNTIVSKLFAKDFGDGEYSYHILMKKASVFKRSETILYEGSFIIGQKEQWKVKGKKLLLKEARCWEHTTGQMVVVPFAFNNICIRYLDFKGYGIPEVGANIEEVPQYEAELCFYDYNKQRWQPFSTLENERYECVNPVRVWLINDHMLMLKTAEEEAVLINKNRCSIVNKKLPNQEAYQYVILPDFFEYRIE